MLPLVTGEREEVNEAVFAEVTYHAAYEPQRAVRTRRWTYIRRYGDRPLPVLANCDESPSRDLWLAAGWGERPLAFEQLYDNVLDPVQRQNLAGDSGYGEVLGELRGRLDAWMRATDDPLLAGAVPLPPGAVANDPDARSAEEG